MDFLNKRIKYSNYLYLDADSNKIVEKPSKKFGIFPRDALIKECDKVALEIPDYKELLSNGNYISSSLQPKKPLLSDAPKYIDILIDICAKEKNDSLFEKLGFIKKTKADYCWYYYALKNSPYILMLCITPKDDILAYKYNYERNCDVVYPSDFYKPILCDYFYDKYGYIVSYSTSYYYSSSSKDSMQKLKDEFLECNDFKAFIEQNKTTLAESFPNAQKPKNHEKGLNREIFTKIVISFYLILNFINIYFYSQIDSISFVSVQTLSSVAIQSCFFFILFIPRLNFLKKSFLWSLFAFIPLVNIFYCIYLCMKKSDKDEINENNLPTEKGMSRIPYLLTLLPFLFVIFLLQVMSNISFNDISTISQFSTVMIADQLVTLVIEVIAILWCYFCLSKRLIDAGEDPYKSWLIVVPFYNIYFLFKWCFVRKV